MKARLENNPQPNKQIFVRSDARRHFNSAMRSDGPRSVLHDCHGLRRETRSNTPLHFLKGPATTNIALPWALPGVGALCVGALSVRQIHSLIPLAAAPNCVGFVVVFVDETVGQMFAIDIHWITLNFQCRHSVFFLGFEWPLPVARRCSQNKFNGFAFLFLTTVIADDVAQ